MVIEDDEINATIEEVAITATITNPEINCTISDTIINVTLAGGGGGADALVGVDSLATPDYIGASSSDGVLRTSSPITYNDGGDYITLGINVSAIDHGDLNGLGDDDHNQYHNDTRGDVRYIYKENTTPFTPDADYEPATKKYVDDSIITDHGDLDGLSDDDHNQYHNDTRGDARYLYIANTTPFTPDADYEPATKKYVDDTELWEIDGTETQLKTADEIDMQSKKIINLLDPTANQDAATKKYTDDEITAIDHGDLNGLTWPNDDHTQYILVNGSRDFTGSFEIHTTFPSLGFRGASNFGTLSWFDAGDYFLFSDEVKIAGTQKLFFNDIEVFIQSDVNGSMVIEADEYVLIRGLLETTIGVPGDIKLGDSSERDMYPETTLKMNLGKGSRWFNDLYAGGSVNLATVTKTANYTIDGTDYVILADASSTTVTLTLPTAVGIAGRTYIIKSKDSSNVVTVDGNGSETIDTSTSMTLSTHESITVQSDGTEWWIL